MARVADADARIAAERTSDFAIVDATTFTPLARGFDSEEEAAEWLAEIPPRSPAAPEWVKDDTTVRIYDIGGF